MSAAPTTKAKYADIRVGDPAPWFTQRSFGNPTYKFDTAAGRYLILCFFGTAADERGRATLKGVLARRSIFDDAKASFFGVSVDPTDESENRIADQMPGLRFFLDFDHTVAKLYGATPQDAAQGDKVALRRFWTIIDPTLRVMKVIPFRADNSDLEEALSYVEGLPPPELFAGFEIPAPILVLPNVFEPDFCANLIAQYEAHGGTESGFVREVEGKTVTLQDPSHKRRKDFEIADQELIRQTQARIIRRVAPEILKAYNFKATRMERYIVSCYAAEDGGHFRPHRDNTTKGTAHRRFAVSINLNADFDGGQVGFPEYGSRGYKAPPGGAVIFPARLLHAVSKVTRGRRYAFLPFLYDDEAAKIREANNRFLGENVGQYRTQ